MYVAKLPEILGSKENLLKKSPECRFLIVLGCPLPRAVDRPSEHLTLYRVLPGMVDHSLEHVNLNQVLPEAVDHPPEHLSLKQVLPRAVD